MEALIPFVVVLLLIMAFLSGRRSHKKAPTKASAASYRRKAEFMSKAELSFFGVLRQAVGERAYISAKVRVADVIEPRMSRGRNASQWQAAFNSIQAKHLDFVLCSPDGGKCWAAIELDDKSHRKDNRRKRDIFLDDAMQSAGLPLVRVPAKRGYSVSELRETLAPYLAAPEHVVEKHVASAPPVEHQPRTCPQCGAYQVRHEGGTGSLAGKRFWKCSQYPECRHVEPITQA